MHNCFKHDGVCTMILSSFTSEFLLNFTLHIVKAKSVAILIRSVRTLSK